MFYLPAVIPALVLVYLIGTFLAVKWITVCGEAAWWARPVAWLWPVTLSLGLLAWLGYEIFWG